MNLQVKKILSRLVVWSLPAFFLLSCEDPNEIGTSLSDIQKPSILYKEFVLDASTIKNNLVQTNFSDQVFTGKYTHEAFGTSEATGYILVSPERYKVIPADFVIDSANIKLWINYYQGKDFSGPQAFSLHAIDEKVIEADSFHYSKDFITLGEKLSEVSKMMDPTVDTILKFQLPTEYTRDLLTKTKTGFDTDTSFITRAFAIQSGEANSVIVGLKPSHTQTILTVYYHNPSDTTSLTYFISTYKSYSYVKSPSEISNPNPDRVYLQEITGFLPQIDFSPYVDFYKDSIENKNIIINRADLVFENVVPQENVNVHVPTEVSFLLNIDSTNQISQNLLNSYNVGTSETSFYTGDPTIVDQLVYKYNSYTGNYNYDDFSGYLGFLGKNQVSRKEVLVISGRKGSKIQNLLGNSFDQLIMGKPKLKIYYTKME